MYTHSQLLGPLAFLFVTRCFLHRPGLIWGHLASLRVPSTLWENTYGVLGMKVYSDLRMQALKSPFLLLLALVYHLLRPESYPVSLCDLLFSSILFSTSLVCKNSSTGPFHSSCVPASFQCCFVCKVCASALPKGWDHPGDVSIIFCWSTFPLLSSLSFLFLSLPSSPFSSPRSYCFDCIFCLCLFQRTTAVALLTFQANQTFSSISTSDTL